MIQTLDNNKLDSRVRASDMMSVIPISESPIGKDPHTTLVLNKRYGVLNKEELFSHLYLSTDNPNSLKVPLPQLILTRGRESGNINLPVLIEDNLGPNPGYKTVGIITVKALGSRNLSDAIHNDYRGGSTGVAGLLETEIDANIAELLEMSGASVGNTIGLLVVPKNTFLEHFRSDESGGPLGRQYAEMLEKNWKEEESKDTSAEYREKIVGNIRITDPERLDPDTFCDVTLLQDSATWLKGELEANGKINFDKRYELPEGYSDHLQNEITGSVETARKQAMLLAYIITRNYAICLRDHIDTSFASKDIGNLGKLHDFPLALNKLMGVEKGEIYKDMLSMTRNSFRDLVNGVASAPNTAVILRPESLLSKDDFIKILDDVTRNVGVPLDQNEIVFENQQSKSGIILNLD